MKRWYDKGFKEMMQRVEILSAVIPECVESLKGVDPRTIAEKCLKHDGHGNVVGPTQHGWPWFDLRFDIADPSGDGYDVLSLMDVEGQNRLYPFSALGKRMETYAAALLASQKPRGGYGSMKNAVSLWIMTDPPASLRGCVWELRPSWRTLSGKGDVPASMAATLSRVLVVFLGDEDAPNKLAGMLATYFSPSLEPRRKVDVLHRKYGILVDKETEGKMEYLYGWEGSVRKQAIREGKAEGIILGKAEGKAEGIILGKAEGIILSVRNLMANLGLSLDQALDAVGCTGAEREACIKALGNKA